MIRHIGACVSALGLVVLSPAVSAGAAAEAAEGDPVIGLPSPRLEGSLSVEAAMQGRRSRREYGADALDLAHVGQLLWAAQGVTSRDGLRTAPSAGALYPLEMYVVAGAVEGLDPGVYHYDPRRHGLRLVADGDRRADLAAAALDQECVRNAAAVLVFAGAYERTTGKYGERGIRYVHMEVGNAAQNVYLQAEALDLATVFVGAFRDASVRPVLSLSKEHRPLGLMPLGSRR